MNANTSYIDTARSNVSGKNGEGLRLPSDKQVSQRDLLLNGCYFRICCMGGVPNIVITNTCVAIAAIINKQLAGKFGARVLTLKFSDIIRYSPECKLAPGVSREPVAYFEPNKRVLHFALHDMDKLIPGCIASETAVILGALGAMSVVQDIKNEASAPNDYSPNKSKACKRREAWAAALSLFKSFYPYAKGGFHYDGRACRLPTVGGYDQELRPTDEFFAARHSARSVVYHYLKSPCVGSRNQEGVYGCRK
jgi:hypothetical protein